MKKIMRMFVVVTMMFLLTTVIVAAQKATEEWKAPASASEKKNPILPTDEKSIAQGKAIYARLCVYCHGTTGKGDGSAAKGLEKSPGDLSKHMNQHTDGDFFWKITEGNKPMPKFKDKLTEEQRWQVINYMRTFTAKNSEKNK